MKLPLLFFLLFSQFINKMDSNFILLLSIFSDNMVLQQKSEVPFWGKANPGNDIFINGSWGASVKSIVLEDSSWTAKLKTPKAGGPYQITIQSGDSKKIYKNVLIGEVWLCSGQSKNIYQFYAQAI